MNKLARLLPVAVICVMLGACTTSSYIEEDGTRVTVKRFMGIPYLEEDVTTTVEPLGSPANPI